MVASLPYCAGLINFLRGFVVIISYFYVIKHYAIMRFLKLLSIAVFITLFTSCADDDPMIKFHPTQREYAINSEMSLGVTLNGAVVTFDGAKVVIDIPGGKIAEIVIKNIVPGYGEITVGGINITQSEDGNGINFEGKIPLDKSTMLIFKGSLNGLNLVIDIQTVPITGI